MDRKKIIELANLIKINPTEEVLNLLESEFNSIKKMLDKLDDLDVENLEPMSHIDETPVDLLREDVVENFESNKEILLKNSKDSTEDFVKIERVIND